MSAPDPEALCVTLNPAVDETVFLDRLVPGTVHRARGFHRRAGGKGVNVASMLAQAGRGAAVTGFLGADNAGPFDELFRARGLRDLFVRVPGETRTGVKLVDLHANETTDVNLAGLEPSSAHLERLEGVVRDCARPGLWVVLSGSLPPGADPAYLAGLAATARRLGAKVAADTSGPPLRAVLDAGVDLVKPNAAELGELLGRDLAGFSEVLAGAAEVRRAGVSHVVVSLGHEGALFLAPDMALMAGAPPARVVSTVGAGDALLAGYLSALIEGRPAAERARAASVFAWCALESLERELAPPAEREARAAQIRVQPLPR